MDKKLLIKKVKKYFSTKEHIRLVSLVGLLFLITAIPFTVYVAQLNQDIRQHAATTGFKSIRAFGCGEVIVPAQSDGASTVDVTFRGPIRTAKGWETHKSDNSIINTEDLFRSQWDQYGTKWQDDIHLKLSRVIEEFTISCTLQIQYGGDCKVDVVGHGGNKDDMLQQGETTTLHISPNTGSSAGCDQTVLVHAGYQSSPPASYPNVTPFQWPAGIDSRWCTDSDGGKVYDQLGVVTNNVDPAKDTQDCNNNGNCTDVDSCVSGALTEYYCQDGHMKSEQYTCPSGCADNWKCRNDGTPLPTGVLPSTSPAPTTTVPTATPTTGGATATPVPTGPTATPTVTPTPTITPTPSNTPTPTQTPTPTLTPTPTMPKTPTQISMTLMLPGIGKSGNQNPNRESRDVTFQLFDSTGKQVGSNVVGHTNFDSGSGGFKGSVNMGTIVTTGSYTAKIKASQYITQASNSSFTVNAGATNAFEQITLIGGDINNDDKIDILDYNILTACFGEKGNTEACGGKQVDADLNDDGTVDGVDYNLFLVGVKASTKK